MSGLGNSFFFFFGRGGLGDIKSHNQGDICVMIPTFQIFSDKKSCVRLSWQEKLDRAHARTDSGTSSL